MTSCFTSATFPTMRARETCTSFPAAAWSFTRPGTPSASARATTLPTPMQPSSPPIALTDWRQPSSSAIRPAPCGSSTTWTRQSRLRGSGPARTFAISGHAASPSSISSSASPAARACSTSSATALARDGSRPSTVMSIPTSTAPSPLNRTALRISPISAPIRRIGSRRSRRCLSSRHAGAVQYPPGFPWSPNIYFVRHLPPSEHAAFFASSRLTLNVTRRAMAEMGWCPSGRLFEAAACGAPLLSDVWEGMDHFFAPGEEIILARALDDALAALEIADDELRLIARRARERTLDQNSSARRAEQLVGLLEQARSAAHLEIPDQPAPQLVHQEV